VISMEMAYAADKVRGASHYCFSVLPLGLDTYLQLCIAPVK
jgi:hypothetical protein